MPPIIPNKAAIDTMIAGGREALVRSMRLDERTLAILSGPVHSGDSVSIKYGVDGHWAPGLAYSITIAVKDQGLLPPDWTYVDVLTALLAQFTAEKLT